MSISRRKFLVSSTAGLGLIGAQTASAAPAPAPAKWDKTYDVVDLTP